MCDLIYFQHSVMYIYIYIYILMLGNKPNVFSPILDLWGIRSTFPKCSYTSWFMKKYSTSVMGANPTYSSKLFQTKSTEPHLCQTLQLIRRTSPIQECSVYHYIVCLWPFHVIVLKDKETRMGCHYKMHINKIGCMVRIIYINIRNENTET